MNATAKLSRPATLAMWMAAVLILGVFVFPLWVIDLHAPQYPQGLGLRIWIDRIEGATPHDLQNINGLNHYIGMAKIEPAGIPELRFMKYFALGLAGLAAVVAIMRRRWALFAWIAIAASLAAVGMWDFYKWEYNYGHNLNPDAAIKITGMSYQPPLFGTKQLLNFTTRAWPGVGGWLAMLGVGLGAVATIYEVGFRRAQRDACTLRRTAVAAAPAIIGAILCLALATASGCARKVASITYGTDACEYCSMTISDNRHGAALLTSKGRTHKFDSIECMLHSAAEGKEIAEADVASWYVTDYAHRATMVDAASATFLVSASVPSPMGANMSAFASRADAVRVQQEKGGDVFDWAGVRDTIRRTQ